MNILTHLDLLSVGIAVAGIALLGVLVLLNNWQSATHRAFFYFSAITVFWSIANYSYYQLPAGVLALWILRLVIFFGVWHAFTFFNLAFVFPRTRAHRPHWYTYGLFPITIATAVLTLTPYVFHSINSVTANGSIGGIENSPGIIVFAILVLFLVVGGISMLAWKTWHASKEQRMSFSMLLYGTVLTFLLLIGFNFFIPAVFNDPQFIPLGALFLLPFILFSAFAILRYNLFKIRVAVIGLLVFYLSVAVFISIIFAQTFVEMLFASSELILVLIFGFWIIRSMLKEVKQRELIERQAHTLEETNARQETLIHFVSHEVKSFLTKDANAMAMLADGDFGALPEQAKSFVESALAQAREGTRSVMSILQAANLKKGTITYKMEPIDISALVKKSFAALAPLAQERGLSFTLSIGKQTEPYNVVGDADQLREHVFRNLIENAIVYTQKGSVTVTLEKNNDGKVIFSVKDTGVGISDEDKERLFTEGGHGKNSIKVNAHSTGYGLYIVKQIIDAHHGTVRAESKGSGDGSRFVVEFPIKT